MNATTAPRILENAADRSPVARVARVPELTSGELARWAALHADCPHLASPYFHPEFARHAAAARAGRATDDVRVAVLTDGRGEPLGFFPHQRSATGFGRPAGGRLCDVHGVIAPPKPHWDAADLLRACGLRAWAFHMLPPGQDPFLAPSVVCDLEVREGVRIDLTCGFDGWIVRREAAGSKRHKKIEQFRRRLVRELGELRFRWHADDPAAWEKLVGWKRAQYAATGFTDVLARPWVRALIERCRDARDTASADAPEFGGVFSALHAGGRLVAVHFGLRSGGRLHSWFPAYDRAVAKLSPGNVLMVELLRAAADRGVDAVDLGTGDERYKYSYGSHTFPLRGGVAEPPGLRREVARAGRRVRDALKTHPAGAPARAAARAVRPLRERLSLR